MTKRSFAIEQQGLAFGEAHSWAPTGGAGSAPGRGDTRCVSPRAPLSARAAGPEVTR
jgi:hypothetical protein